VYPVLVDIPVTTEEIVKRAQGGDATALNDLIVAIQPKIYGLALRMLWHPEDARDAAQEILLRVVTHLATFRGDSSFLTWAYRVAANHLLTWRRSRMETQGFTFETFREDLEEGLEDKSQRTEDTLLFQEIRIGCTLGMLLCLDRVHRITYVLGEILEVDSKQGASILRIKPDAFRKRLERARKEIVQFMTSHCGLANPEKRCRCDRRLRRAIELKRVDRKQLLFAHDRTGAREFPSVLASIRKLEEAQRAVALYRSHPEYRAPDFVARVRQLLVIEGNE
jgi:RNA polymerase sigma factor (sigma-70 family)